MRLQCGKSGVEYGIIRQTKTPDPVLVTRTGRNANEPIVADRGGAIVASPSASVYPPEVSPMLLTVDDDLRHCPTLPCVYVIRCNEFYKIGRASNPLQRLGDLQIGCPYELRLVQVFYTSLAGAAALEAELHERYAEYRVRGEWFALPVTHRNNPGIAWPEQCSAGALRAYQLRSGYLPAYNPPSRWHFYMSVAGGLE